MTRTDRPTLPGRAPGLLLVVVAVLGCSGGDLALPEPGPGSQVHLAIVDGNEQTGTVGEPLPEPVVAELRDEFGHAIAGRRVAFVAINGPAAAELTPDTAVTDDDGQVVGQWTLGPLPGTYNAEVKVIPAEGDDPGIGLPTAQLTASAQPGAPNTLRAESKLGQVGVRGQPVQDPPVVRVVDRYGNPVSGVPVRWEITAGGGQVSAPVVLTDAKGQATVSWTLGNKGRQRLEASVDGQVSGSPIEFAATLLVLF